MESVNLVVVNGWLTSLILVVLGLVIVFAGKPLLKLAVGLLFGLITSYYTYVLFTYLNAGTLASLLLAFIVFIIGTFIGWFIFKIALSIVFGIIAGSLLATVFKISGNIILLILIIVVCITIIYLLIELAISVAVTLFGLTIFFTGVFVFTNNLLISCILTICLAAVAVASKLRS